MTDEGEFDPSERAALRKIRKLWSGNGDPGIPEQIRRLRRDFYLAVAAIIGLAGLVLDGRLRFAGRSPTQNQGVVIGAADNANQQQSTPATLTPRQGAIEYGEALGYLTTRMYAVWSLEGISESEVRDRCARAEIPDAYKGRDGHWRIPWPRPEKDGTIAAN